MGVEVEEKGEEKNPSGERSKYGQNDFKIAVFSEGWEIIAHTHTQKAKVNYNVKSYVLHPL